MYNYRLLIEYNGAKYRGWQRLQDSDKTIQGKIEEVLSKMTGESVEIIGSGRTDAGVHAYGQVANFKTAELYSPEEILGYANEYLPKDILIKKVEQVEERFHSRFHAKSKIYLYRIWNQVLPSVFEGPFTYYVPEELDLDSIKEATKFLVGTHDFKAFSTASKGKKSTVRTIHSIKIEKKGPLLEIKFHGEGFLYNMVRIMVGTLLAVGLGELKAEDIPSIREKGIRQFSGEKVPPQGLFLKEVRY